MRYEPVIGLEVHLQLKTRSKMFAPDPNHNSDQPNTTISAISLGHPGTLPSPNKLALELGIRMSLALNCEINVNTKFDRKHYFYPDLPKGYQISQFDLPVGKEGHVEIDVKEGPESYRTMTIGIERLHLEEDAAKNIHDSAAGKTFIDYNRAGVPLIELVSKPDLRSPEEAKAYLQEIRLLARTLGISDADMEKGQMRCDANISLRCFNDDGSLAGEFFNPKTEIKNLNSFRMVERALAYEIKRQTSLWESNSPPAETTTRGWDDARGVTVLQRVKESSADYRYFPDPDLPPLDLTSLVEVANQFSKELPRAKRERFRLEYRLSQEDARILIENPSLADYAEAVFSELHAWVESKRTELNEEQVEQATQRLSNLVGSWLLNNWLGVLHTKKQTPESSLVTPENFAELILLLADDAITSANALKTLEYMTDTGADPNHIIEEQGFGKLNDEGPLVEAVQRTLEAHPTEVERYLNGEEKLLKFLMGIVMKETEGRADPGLVQNLISVELESRRS